MTVEILFEKAFLFGDEWNANYLRRLLPDAEFICTDLLDKPYFAEHKPDLIYMGATSERNQQRAIAALRPYKDRLVQLIDEGVHMLFTGNSIDIFGEYVHIVEFDEVTTNRYDALGIFPFHTKLEMADRYYGSFLGKAQGIDFVGFKTQFGHMYDLPEDLSFITVKRGVGIHPGVSYEGIHKNNFYATYLIGPLLVLNPLFTKFLMKSLGQSDKLPFEDVTMKAYRLRLEEFKDKSRHIG
ncbi:MAG: hypothetical protein IJO14_11665 [Clostridia bacterium]|nr:hypothetical protein [Clostridia bacterium]